MIEYTWDYRNRLVSITSKTSGGRANLVLRPPYAANAPPSSPHPRFTRP
ncbi:hypothetical protein AB1L30_00800 [Bremerella sp. JC817]